MEAVGGGEKGAAERLGERSVKLNCLSVCLSVSDSVCLSACLSVCMLNVFLMNQLGFKLISILTRQVHITLFQIFFLFLASILDGFGRLGRMTRNAPGP